MCTRCSETEKHSHLPVWLAAHRTQAQPQAPLPKSRDCRQPWSLVSSPCQSRPQALHVIPSLSGGRTDNHDVARRHAGGLAESGTEVPGKARVLQAGVCGGRHSSTVDSWAKPGSSPGMKGPARNCVSGPGRLTAAAGAPTTREGRRLWPEDGVGVAAVTEAEQGQARSWSGRPGAEGSPAALTILQAGCHVKDALVSSDLGSMSGCWYLNARLLDPENSLSRGGV